MQPWRHAMLTARKRNAPWQDDLEIHEFIDFAKVACPDLRHRLVLHNSDLGPTLAQQAFPERTDCSEIVREHIKQDLKKVPSLSEWIGTAHRRIKLSWRNPNDEMVVDAACKNIGLDDPSPVLEVLSVLKTATRFLSVDEGLARYILMNSFGPSLVRRLIGPAYVVRSKEKDIIFDPSWVAEGIIVANFGRIEPLSKVLAPFSGQV